MLLVCSGASTLVHRSVYEAARHGPAQAAEVGLALLTFILASTGILLLIHGAALFKPAPDRASGDHRRARDGRSRLEPSIAAEGRSFDTRHGAAMMHARHRIALVRRRRPTDGSDPGTLDRASFDWTNAPQR